MFSSAILFADENKVEDKEIEIKKLELLKLLGADDSSTLYANDNELLNKLSSMKMASTPIPKIEKENGHLNILKNLVFDYSVSDELVLTISNWHKKNIFLHLVDDLYVWVSRDASAKIQDNQKFELLKKNADMNFSIIKGPYLSSAEILSEAKAGDDVVRVSASGDFHAGKILESFAQKDGSVLYATSFSSGNELDSLYLFDQKGLRLGVRVAENLYLSKAWFLKLVADRINLLPEYWFGVAISIVDGKALVNKVYDENSEIKVGDQIILPKEKTEGVLAYLQGIPVKEDKYRFSVKRDDKVIQVKLQARTRDPKELAKYIQAQKFSIYFDPSEKTQLSQVLGIIEKSKAFQNFENVGFRFYSLKNSGQLAWLERSVQLKESLPNKESFVKQMNALLKLEDGLIQDIAINEEIKNLLIDDFSEGFLRYKFRHLPALVLDGTTIYLKTEEIDNELVPSIYLNSF